VVALRREGLSTGRIAERLDAEGVPARGPRWRRETVRRLLEQESVA